MHSPNYKKAVCLFFKPDLNFLSLNYCRYNCFYSVGVGDGLGLLLFEWACMVKMAFDVLENGS